MSNIEPILHEAWQRRWLRPDWQRWMRPDAHRFAPPGIEAKDAQAAPVADAAFAAELRRLQAQQNSLRRMLAGVQFELALRRLRRKYSPDQPRVPAGSGRESGRWTDVGGGGQSARSPQPTGVVLSDASPDPLKPGAQLAAMSWEERRRVLFGQGDLFRGEGPGGGIARPYLPTFKANGPTSGVLRSPGQPDIELVSGKGGPASQMPQGAPGFDAFTLTHVEGHAAALMRERGITEGMLHINNPEICPSCAKLLPRMLPPGAKLNVVLPSGEIVPFVGVAP